MRLPTPVHGEVLDQVLATLRADHRVLGVLLAGSLARGTARPDSDLDILAVTDRAVLAADPLRSRTYALPVDLLLRTAGEWRTRFTPTRPGDESWGYAFRDAAVLHDPTGVAAGLAAEVAGIHARYRVPEEIRAHYAALWRHALPKLRAVLARDDPVEIGWAAAVMTNDLLRTAWVVNDLPNPSLDLGTVQRHLDDLTTPAGIATRLRTLLQSAPEPALHHHLTLIPALLDLLT